MVFVLYKVYNSKINCVAVYECEKDAVNDKTNLILDSPVEDLDAYKYEIVESHYFKENNPVTSSYTEEDSNIDEEEYYELEAKSKHQREEIILLKEELLNLKDNYAYIMKEYSNDMFSIVLTVSMLLILFIMLFIACLV